jgi:hypothetical protein
MQLNVARLCLDCEEIHDDAQRCPVCASETFAYLTRWVPRIDTRTAPPPPARPLVVPTVVQRIVFGGGVISLLAYGWMRWSKRARHHVEVISFRKAGELR